MMSKRRQSAFHGLSRWAGLLAGSCCLLGETELSIAPPAVVFHRLGATAQAAESAFVEGFEDLPLMPGLTQDPGTMIRFDSRYGRIIESSACGCITRAAVRRFYDRTLPQLGWQPVVTEGPALTFRREGEDLSITITRQNGVMTVYFQSLPH